MHNFNQLDSENKVTYHHQLSACATSLGGKNFFLKMIEDIRCSKPHPIMSKGLRFHFSHGTISWNKVIFQDKFTLLTTARTNESKQNNLLPDKSDKSYKKILNLTRALRPITFTFKPKNSADGDGFSIEVFDIIDEHTTRLNPLFDAIFFCSIDTLKKILSYKTN